MSDGSPIKTFITGACAGLAEVRQALQGHPEIEIVGTAVEPGKADQKLASSGAQVILHGTARGDRLPGAEIDAIRHATAAPIILVTSGGAGALLHEALGAGIADVVMLPQLMFRSDDPFLRREFRTRGVVRCAEHQNAGRDRAVLVT